MADDAVRTSSRDQFCVQNDGVGWSSLEASKATGLVTEDQARALIDNLMGRDDLMPESREALESLMEGGIDQVIQVSINTDHILWY